MQKNMTKIAFLSLSLLVVPVALQAKEEKSSVVTFKDLQKNKSALDIPLGAGITATFGFDVLGWGLKYDYETGVNPTGNGNAKFKFQVSIGDMANIGSYVGQLARIALVEMPLASDTAVGQKVAAVSAYLLFVKKEVRAKMAELVALQKEQPVTLEEQRAHVSKIVALKAEIAGLLA